MLARRDQDVECADRVDVDDLVADATRARGLLGWEPEVSLDEGLGRTIEWVRANPRLYDPATYRI